VVGLVTFSTVDSLSEPLLRDGSVLRNLDESNGVYMTIKARDMESINQSINHSTNQPSIFMYTLSNEIAVFMFAGYTVSEMCN
jgi:hypothetical protein